MYYGQVTYVDGNGRKSTLEEIQAAEPEQDEEGNEIDPMLGFKRIRNGLGVQLWGCTEMECKMKYEGEWNMDEMNGQGKCTYQDKSYYEGQLRHNKRQGAGFFHWENGFEYEGSWRNDRMEGQGVFTHPLGQDSPIKGIFKNNYLYQNGEFINPFLQEVGRGELVSHFKEQRSLEEQRMFKENAISFYRIGDPKQIYEQL
jgi:hypothetical protein